MKKISSLYARKTVRESKGGKDILLHMQAHYKDYNYISNRFLVPFLKILYYKSSTHSHVFLKFPASHGNFSASCQNFPASAALVL